MQPANTERATSKAAEQKRSVLIVQVLWACHVFNATPEQAAQQVVADLFDRVTLLIEYRYTYCRVGLGELGAMQVGGNSFYLGVQVAFPPEDKRLKALQP